MVGRDGEGGGLDKREERSGSREGGVDSDKWERCSRGGGWGGGGIYKRARRSCRLRGGGAGGAQWEGAKRGWGGATNGRGEVGRGGKRGRPSWGGIIIVGRGHSRKAIATRMSTIPRRSPWDFHGPGRRCLHQARNTVTCPASRMGSELDLLLRELLARRNLLHVGDSVE